MPWVDPDDAPQPAGEPAFPARKRMGRPPVEMVRPTLNMRVDADVLDALRASGKGWQTRLNVLLRREFLDKGA